MFKEKREKFSLSDISSLSGCSISTVRSQINDLLDILVKYDKISKKYFLDENSKFYNTISSLFEQEKEIFQRKSLFEYLGELGAYYITGSSSIILRGLSRDLIPSISFLFIIGDRNVSKSRGAIKTFYSTYDFLILEDKIDPRDYFEIETLFEERVTRINTAVTEKAIADTIWKITLDRNFEQVIYYLAEQEFDENLLFAYSKKHGKTTESRLYWILNKINKILGKKIFRVKNIKFYPEMLKLSTSYQKRVEEAIRRVLGS